MNATTYDDSAWPLLVITLASAISPEVFVEHRRVLRDAYLVRREPHVVVIDLRELISWTASAEANLVGGLKGSEKEFALYRRGLAIVGQPPPGAAAEALQLLFEAPYPVKVFYDPRLARAWASERMRGVTRPSPRGEAR